MTERVPGSGREGALGDGTAPGAVLTPEAFAAAAHAAGYGLQAVHDRMRSALSGRGEHRDRLRLYDWLRYHLGWSSLEGEPQSMRSGKGIRPLLTLLSSAAKSGATAPAEAIAAAIELTHEFSLIHDDIEDQDRERRGRPTLWSVVGEAQAINAGDALFVIAREQIAKTEALGLSAKVVLALYRRYDDACLQLAEGQYLDIDFESRSSVDIEAYRAMVLGKTGALIGAAAAMGAIAAGADEDEAAAFDAYGRGLGIGFQMHDDILGIWGDPAKTGKPAGNDLRQRKRSLPILLAQSHAELGPRLEAIFDRAEPIDVDQVAAWTRRLEEAGIRAAAESMARAEIDTARSAIAGLELAPEPAQLLEQLLRLSVERDR